MSEEQAQYSTSAALQTVEPVEARAVLSAADMRQHVSRIQQVMQAVMKNETHYGKIPGTPKPTLYKAGSEVLLTTFKIGVEPTVEDLSGDGEVRYRVRCRGFHIATGATVGFGVGECSSGEDKYKWRSSVCDEEYSATDDTRRRTKYGRKRGGGHYIAKQVRVEPADVANTILKMAKKRAQIDLTLTATGASDIFAQDLEDMPEEVREAAADRQAPQGSTLTESQAADLDSKLSEVGANRVQFLQWRKVASLDQIQQKDLPVIYRKLELKAKQEAA